VRGSILEGARPANLAPGREIGDIDIGAVLGDNALDVGAGLGAIRVIVLDGLDDGRARQEGGFVIVLGGPGDGVKRAGCA
jgi:hypothetical protein